MYLCVCKAVKEEVVRKLRDAGHGVREIQRVCGAGTDCGACVAKLLALASRDDADANAEGSQSDICSDK